MTTNNLGKLNVGGLAAIRKHHQHPAQQTNPSAIRPAYLAACLTALAHQPSRWYSYQDWGDERSCQSFGAESGIEFPPSETSVLRNGLRITDASATKHIGGRRNHDHICLRPTQE